MSGWIITGLIVIIVILVNISVQIYQIGETIVGCSQAIADILREIEAKELTCK